ncbi:serine/threonine-protein kinase [Hyalangium versicolor]|uniref:serine/threonine-protein kinase n=1 Tax=Hyalangium versicolor TaxID=2861190 RepID=UPI001CCBE058|nr:serine/threonine-protein kinase [Hyalangium versicolor]
MRCPRCHRRLLPAAACPLHGEPAPSLVEEEPLLSLPPGFQALSLLGRGGFSQVVAALRARDGQQVALKLARTQGDRRFPREAQALRRLGPPTTPLLLEEGVHEARPFLALEQLQGETLARFMAALPGSGALPPGEAAGLLVSILEAVARLHAVGLVHRDLKPENIFLRRQGLPALIDLGLARDADATLAAPEPEPVTLTGEQPGTLLYMAPELCAGPAPVSATGDVYALGVIFFELLTGRPPFTGDRAEVLQGHSALRPPRLASFQPAAVPWEPFLLRCLAKEPTHRFAHGGQMLAELRRVQAAGPVPTAESPLSSGSSAPRSRARAVALLAVAARAPLPEPLSAFSAEGGVLARVHPELYVAAFPEALSPVAGLKAAARAALRWGRDRRLLHLAELQVHMGRGGIRLAGAALEELRALWARVPPGEHTWVSPEASPWLGTDILPEREGGYHLLREDRGMGVGLAAQPAPPLVGREPLLAALEARAVESLRRSRPGLVVLEGGPGSGRTRVLEALEGQLSLLSGARVVRLGSRPEYSQGQEPLLKPLLALAPEPLPEEELTAARHLPPDARRQRLAQFVARALRARASRGPLLLLLDDAGHLDTVTLDAVVQATSGEEPLPLWICLASGPELVALRPALVERSGPDGICVLQPLTPEDSQQLLRALLSPVEYVPQALLEQLAALAGGIPRYLVELVRALHATGSVRRTVGGAWELSLEAGPVRSVAVLLEPLAEQSLSALPPSLQSLARLGAVMGEGLSEERFAQALPLLEQEPSLAALASLDAGAGLRRLARAGLLHEGSSGAYSFSHPVLRESLEAGLPLHLRVLLHRAALATTGGTPQRDALLRQRARHATVVGEVQLACEAWLELAERARKAFRDVDAEQACSAALELLPAEDAPRRLRALAARGRVRLRSHRYREAGEDVARAAELALELGERAEAALLLLEQATARDWLEDWEAADALVGRAMEVGQGLAEQEPLAGRLALARGRTEGRRGRWDVALPLLEQAARGAEHSGDTEVLSVSLTMWPVGLAYLGRLEEAESVFSRALSHCQSCGDTLHLAVVHMNRFALWLSRLDLTRAVEDLRQAQTLARALAHVQVERFSTFNLAVFLLMLGRVPEAEAAALRALELGQRFFPEPSLGADRLLMARLCLEKGQGVEARQHVDWVETHAAPPPDSTPELLLALVRQVLAQEAEGCFAKAQWDALLAQARERCAPFELVDVLLEAGACAVRARAHEPLQHLLAEAEQLVTRTPAFRTRLDALMARAASV